MQSGAKTVEEYLKSLPEERRKIISQVRAVLLRKLPKGYEESMDYGMIVYSIPLRRHPETYNGKPLCYAGLASQKHYVSLYLMSVYGGNEAWLRREFKAAGTKLNAGKGCIRFRKIEDLPLSVIGRAIALFTPEKFIEHYEKARAASRRAAARKRKS